MGSAAIKEKQQDNGLQVVQSLDDLLLGNTYTMLSYDRMLFKNEKGNYVIFRIDAEKEYTKEDYLKLPEGAPYELLNGKLTHMASPFDYHQNISWNLSLLLGNFNKIHKLGILRAAPYDVHFDKKNVIQPDFIFISNERKHIIEKWAMGAPDLVIEIHSKSTKKKDIDSKFKLFEKHGVKEYWMVDTDKKTVNVQILKNKKFHQKAEYKIGEILKSEVLTGLEIPVDEIFEKDI